MAEEYMDAYERMKLAEKMQQNSKQAEEEKKPEVWKPTRKPGAYAKSIQDKLANIEQKKATQEVTHKDDPPAVDASEKDETPPEEPAVKPRKPEIVYIKDDDEDDAQEDDVTLVENVDEDQDDDTRGNVDSANEVEQEKPKQVKIEVRDVKSLYGDEPEPKEQTTTEDNDEKIVSFDETNDDNATDVVNGNDSADDGHDVTVNTVQQDDDVIEVVADGENNGKNINQGKSALAANRVKEHQSETTEKGDTEMRKKKQQRDEEEQYVNNDDMQMMDEDDPDYQNEDDGIEEEDDVNEKPARSQKSKNKGRQQSQGKSPLMKYILYGVGGLVVVMALGMGAVMFLGGGDSSPQPRPKPMRQMSPESAQQMETNNRLLQRASNEQRSPQDVVRQQQQRGAELDQQNMDQGMQTSQNGRRSTPQGPQPSRRRNINAAGDANMGELQDEPRRRNQQPEGMDGNPELAQLRSDIREIKTMIKSLQKGQEQISPSNAKQIIERLTADVRNMSADLKKAIEENKALKDALVKLEKFKEEATKKDDRKPEKLPVPELKDDKKPDQLKGWTILGFSTNRVIVQDAKGNMHDLGKNDSLDGVKILDINLSSGLIKTSAGNIKYNQ